jgi:probable O-glycosylation ligase (exosortase A-associated)
VRDLLVFGIVMGLLPVAFRRPYVGLLLFSWLAYMRPQDLCWGFARGMRFSFMVAIAMVIGWFAHESHLRPFWRRDFRTGAMIALVALTLVSFAFATNQSTYVVTYLLEFVKIVVIALFTTGQVDSRQRLRWLLWTIALCLAFFGIKGGLFGVLSGGRPILRGPGGMLEDNNDFALALTMGIPMLFYLGASERNRLVRRLALGGVALTIVTIVLTHSRGGFLALTGTVLWMAWRSGRLLRATGTLALAAALFWVLAPASVKERLATIKQGGEESSARARIESWTVALNMIEANPVIGVGIRNFQTHYHEFDERKHEEGFAYVAHNSYLQIWAEGGTIAFAVYLLLLGSVFTTCRRLRRQARARPDLDWLGHYARMFEATTAGFMVGAVFLNSGHFDLIYHWLALLTATVFVAARVAREAPQPAPAAGGAARARVAGARAAARVRVRAPALGPNLLPRWGR